MVTLISLVIVSLVSKVLFPRRKSKVTLSLSLLVSMVVWLEKSERVIQVCSTVGQS